MNRRILCILAVLGLTACASRQDTSLYYWKGYSDQVYAQLQEKHAKNPVAEMEQYFNQAASQNKKAAPGAHAHLGLLYLNEGNSQQAKEQWLKEKELFPESATFIDFLLKTSGRK